MTKFVQHGGPIRVLRGVGTPLLESREKWRTRQTRSRYQFVIAGYELRCTNHGDLDDAESDGLVLISP